MSRQRMLHPNLRKDDEFAACVSIPARYLWEGLWTIADRQGRLPDRPLWIKAEVYPYDDVDIKALLAELIEYGCLVAYEAGGKKLLWCRNFRKYHRPHKHEPASTLPPCPVDVATSPVADFACPPESESESESETESESDTPTPVVKVKPAAVAARVAVVFDHWRSVMEHAGAKLSPKRSKAVEARLREGHSVEDLCRAIDGCKASAFHQGDNERKAVFDDLELICRDTEHVEKFQSYLKPKQRGQPGVAFGQLQTTDELDAKYRAKYGGEGKAA